MKLLKKIALAALIMPVLASVDGQAVCCRHKHHSCHTHHSRRPRVDFNISLGSSYRPSYRPSYPTYRYRYYRHRPETKIVKRRYYTPERRVLKKRTYYDSHYGSYRRPGYYRSETVYEKPAYYETIMYRPSVPVVVEEVYEVHPASLLFDFAGAMINAFAG